MRVLSTMFNWVRFRSPSVVANTVAPLPSIVRLRLVLIPIDPSTRYCPPSGNAIVLPSATVARKSWSASVTSVAPVASTESGTAIVRDAPAAPAAGTRSVPKPRAIAPNAAIAAIPRTGDGTVIGSKVQVRSGAPSAGVAPWPFR